MVTKNKETQMELKKTFLSKESTQVFLDTIGIPGLLEVESPEA